MLIGVTSFFRDPPLWQELKDTVLPALLGRRTPATPMRAWVVGCSTGEEAYSLAMVFREVADTQPNPNAWALQIFASDVNADAIAAARKGQFPSNIAVDVAPERLSRFFNAAGNGFLIKQEIRQTILFAQHDVTLDPQFTRLEILSCRNPMIYFNAALQQRVLPVFHYAMRPGGVLLHELQVLQVELDLQDEELRRSRADLEITLNRQITLYDFAPVGCFTVDQSTAVRELNLTAASMLGAERDRLLGRSLDSFLAPQSARALHVMLTGVSDGAQAEVDELELLARRAAPRRVHACANRDPDGEHFLIVFVDVANGGQMRGAQS